jgi:hypothetical protein
MPLETGGNVMIEGVMTALPFEIRGPFDRETEGTVPHLQVHEITTVIITAATTILNSIAQPLIPEALPRQ